MDEQNEFYSDYKEYKKEASEITSQDEQKLLDVYLEKLKSEGYDEFEILEKLTVYQNELHKNRN